MFSAAVRVAPIRLVWLVALFLAPGCGPSGWGQTSGVRVEPPTARWRPVAADTWNVPGVALAAWSGPDGSSLVAYRSLPIPGGTPEALVDELANRLENLPGVLIRERRTEAAGGAIAAHVEVVAPGTGDALAPSGSGTAKAPAKRPLVPTHQTTFGFVRPDETFSLRWHAPEASYERIAADIRATLDSLHLAAGDHPPPPG